MTNSFNEECPTCKITIERITRWIDHVGCSPNKYQRYSKMLEFIKMLAKERPDNDPIYKFINESARDLLKEIGEL